MHAQQSPLKLNKGLNNAFTLMTKRQNEIYYDGNWANSISGDLQFDFRDVKHQYCRPVSVLNCSKNIALIENK